MEKQNKEEEEIATDGIMFGEADAPSEPDASDISIASDDSKEEPKDDKEPKEEDKKEEPKVEVEADKKEDAPEKSEDKSEDKAEDKKEDSEDLDLSDLFSDIEDASEATDASQKILDDAAAAGGTLTTEQVAELQAQLSIYKDINDKNGKLLKKLMADSVDLNYKNAELEAFGGVSTDPNILILSKNLEKAKAGDDKSKSKIVTILKSLYEEFTGEDLDKMKVDQQTDLLSAVDSYNSSSNPNIKKKSNDAIEGLSM